jgi:chemosensory pili system protein ChpA (sensor histidine kinase/response regulator)
MSRVDPSTLGWVKTEIDNTLKQARLALESYAESTSDTTRLRFFITHIHQVVGTLQMVELDGAALLAREVESLAEALLDAEVEPTDDVFELLVRAILALSDYLEQLLVGRRDIPLRLVPLLNRLREVRDDTPFEEISLFQPDLSVYPAPNKERKEEVSDEEYSALASKLRGIYLSALLDWLRGRGDGDALKRIADVLDRLERLSRFGSVCQLWWVARGLLEALEDGSLDAANDVKKLLVRVDWQIKKLVHGSEAALIREPADELVNAMLFHVGRSRSGGEHVAALREAFDLDALLDDGSSEPRGTVSEGPSQDTLRSVAKAITEEAEVAQELLGAFFDPERDDVDDLFGLEEHLGRMSKALDTIDVPQLKALVDELEGACRAVSDRRITDLENASLQMAGALLVVENAARELGRDSRSWEKQIDSSMSSLRGLVSAPLGGAAGIEGIELSEAALTETEFEQLLGVVAGEIHVNLRTVEETMEAFAGDTQRVEVLDDVPRHLSQIQGAMQILGQDRAAELISTTNHYIGEIHSGRLVVDNAVLDALAISVGSIEAFVEGLEHGRHNVDSVIESAMRELNAAVTDKRVADLDPAVLGRDILAHFETWLENTSNPNSLLALKQSLRDVAAIAERQDEPKIGKICGELINLLEIITEDPSFLSDDIVQTLKRSIDTLLTLSEKSLRPGKGVAETAEATPTPRHAHGDEVGAAEDRRDAGQFVGGEEEPDDEILQIFLEEAQEVQQAIGERLREWQADPGDHAALAELRRAFHTLKGSGRLAGAIAIGELGWVVENLLNHVLNGKAAFADGMVPFVDRARETVAESVGVYERGERPQIDLDAWRREAETLLGTAPPPEPSAGGDAGAARAWPQGGGEQSPGADGSAPQVFDEAFAEPEPEGIDPVVLEIFTREVGSHLDTIDRELDGEGDSAAGREVTSELLRAIHTLQGTSRSLSFNPMARCCGLLEEMLDGISLQGAVLDTEAQEMVRQADALIRRLLDELNGGGEMSEGLAGGFDDLSARVDKRISLAPDYEPWYLKSDQEESGEEQPVYGPQAPPAEDQSLAPEARAPEVIAEPHFESPPPEPYAQAPAALEASRPAQFSIEDEIDPALQEIFYEEAVDILAQVNDTLARWRATGSDEEAVAGLKRALHTLKGSARMAHAAGIGELSHNTESLLDKVEEGRIPSSSALVSLLEEVHDNLAEMVGQMQQQEQTTDLSALNTRVLAILSGQRSLAEHGEDRAPRAEDGPAESAPQPAPSGREQAFDAAPPTEPRTGAPEAMAPDAQTTPATADPEPASMRTPPAEDATEDAAPVDRRDERRGLLRVSSALLDNLSNYAGEVSIARSRVQQQVFSFRENLHELHANVTRFREQLRELEIQAETQIMARPEATGSSVGDDFDPLEFDRYSRLQQLSRSLSESLNDLVTIQSGLDNFVGDVENTLQQQARLNTELQEGLMRTRMVSISTQIARLRHIVRQTARELGKRVEFDVTGAEVEIDRKVLDRMLGPLEHMIRNAIDHGIEGTQARRDAGKPEAGRIAMECRQEGNEVVIRFADDGRGLDLPRIRGRALDRGLIQNDSGLSDQEVGQLILTPGFTTVDTVTHLSGRGVGMDVVYNEVKQLGGSILIESRTGKGATFDIRLPLTLSIMQALIVRAGDQHVAVPVASIISIHKVSPDEAARGADAKQPVFTNMGVNYPYFHLARRLGTATAVEAEGNVPILLVRAGTHSAAMQVDEIEGRQEIVVKPLGRQVSELPGISGATILGDGSVVLILDIGELWVTKDAVTIVTEPEEFEVAQDRRVPTVMVVDDSLTVRKVTDRLLRKQGMSVVLAKDGVEAIEKLREGIPDVMLVDIEMPRMDGYELTSRVRSESLTRHIPIIIITSRAGAKHKQKAMELGANVYLTKPFQEEDLLAQIEPFLEDQRAVH